MSYSTDFDFASKNLNKLFFFDGVFYRLVGVTLEKNTPFFLAVYQEEYFLFPVDTPMCFASKDIESHFFGLSEYSIMAPYVFVDIKDLQFHIDSCKITNNNIHKTNSNITTH